MRSSTPSHDGRHSFEEHTGEVRIRLAAGSFRTLLGEAGRALAELLAGEQPRPVSDVERISLQARDRAALLVDWLNELIFLSETRKHIYSELEVTHADEHQLDAMARGWPASELRTQVKAATFHGLTVSEGPEGFTAEVVVDV